MRHIIVDGYNVIRADPRLLAFERRSLLGVRRHAHRRQVGKIEVVYSPAGRRADDLIMAQAERLAGTGTVIVVSNDREIQDRCHAAGCRVSGSENLLGQLPGRARPEPDDEDEIRTLSTTKRGNPRRAPRGRKRQRDVRF